MELRREKYDIQTVSKSVNNLPVFLPNRENLKNSKTEYSRQQTCKAGMCKRKKKEKLGPTSKNLAVT